MGKRVLDPGQITQPVTGMHPHQCWFIRLNCALDQCQVLTASDLIGKTHRLKFAKLGVQRKPLHFVYRLLVQHAVLNQIGDGSRFQAMLSGKFQQIGFSRHAAVVIHDFHYHRRRLKTRQTRQIATGFGVTGPLQYPTGTSPQGKNMTGGDNVLGLD